MISPLNVEVGRVLDRLFPTRGRADVLPDAADYRWVTTEIPRRWARLPRGLRRKIRNIERAMIGNDRVCRMSPPTKAELNHH